MKKPAEFLQGFGIGAGLIAVVAAISLLYRPGLIVPGPDARGGRRQARRRAAQRRRDDGAPSTGLPGPLPKRGPVATSSSGESDALFVSNAIFVSISPDRGGSRRQCLCVVEDAVRTAADETEDQHDHRDDEDQMMNPLVTWNAKNPRSQRTKRTTKIVQSMLPPYPRRFPRAARVLASLRESSQPRAWRVSGFRESTS